MDGPQVLATHRTVDCQSLLPRPLRPARSPPSDCHVLETTPGSQRPVGVNGRPASAPAGARADPGRVPSRGLSRQLRPQRFCPASAGSAPSADLLPESPGPGGQLPLSPAGPASAPRAPTGRPSRCSAELGPVPAPLLADPAPAAVGVTDTACGGTGTSGSNSARATRPIGCLAVPSSPAPAPPSRVPYLVAFARGAPDAIGDSRGLIHVRRSWGPSSPPSKLVGARRRPGGLLSRGSGARGWPRVGAPRGSLPRPVEPAARPQGSRCWTHRALAGRSEGALPALPLRVQCALTRAPASPRGPLARPGGT